MHFTNGYDHPVVGPETSMEAYHPVSPISPGSITLAEAVVAVDKLIAYVEAQPPPFISDQARDSLAHVKFALYNAGNGVAYERS